MPADTEMTSARQGETSGVGDVFPRPDPTTLTNQLVDRAIANLKEILLAHIEGNHAIIIERLNQDDEAVKLLQNWRDQIPGMIKDEIAHLEKFHDERFNAFDQRLRERDEQVKQAKEDAQLGIKDALASAEKLVGQANDNFKEQFNKSENSTTQLLAKQEQLQSTEARALSQQLSDLKTRFDRFEGAAVGVITQKADAVQTTQTSHSNTAWLVGLGVAAIAAIEFISKFVGPR